MHVCGEVTNMLRMNDKDSNYKELPTIITAFFWVITVSSGNFLPSETKVPRTYELNKREQATRTYELNKREQATISLGLTNFK
jgi:hypothetical protein